nr:hypothetical protein [Micromonospora sp. DSM 115978]
MRHEHAESLAAMVLSYLDDDEVALLPDDPVTEVRLNTWSYSVGAGTVNVPAVVAALDVVAAALRQRLATRSSGTFYAWYDEQAGALRCSLSSFPPVRLPFRAPYLVTSDAVAVVHLAAADAEPGVVPCSDLVDVTDDAVGASMPQEQPPPPFPVWCAALQ